MSYREHAKLLLKAFGFIALYFALGLLFGFVFPNVNSVQITLCVDALLCAVGFRVCFRNVFPKDVIFRQNRGEIERKIYALRIVEVLSDWLLIQLTVAIFQRFVSDGSFANYQKAMSSASAFEVTFLAVFMAPLTEEILMRGWVQSTLRDGYGPVAAIVISSVLFAVLHGTFMHLYIGAVMGLVFGILYEEFRFLPLCVFCHAVCNALGILLSGCVFSSSNVFLFVVIGLNVWMLARILYCLHDMWANYKIRKLMASNDYEESLSGDINAKD